MKKIFTILSAVMLTCSLSAQKWTDRWTDDSYLPEAGNWSIGFDATSSLNYFGNLFNAGATAPTADYVSGPDHVSDFDQTIYGKLMTSDNEALRVRLGIKMYKDVDRTDVADNDPDADAGDTVEDKVSIGETDINLWVGKEFRKGSARIQGVYGAEAGLGMESKTTTYDYGNSVDQEGTGPLKVRDGMQLGIGLRAFIGAEYFVLPSMSIGAEYGWGFYYKFQGGGSAKSNAWVADSNGDMYEDETETKNANDNEIGFKNDNATGSLVLRMYF